MQLTANTISLLMPTASKTAVAQFTPHLSTLPVRFGINTVNRLSAFLAQIAHESGEFLFIREQWGPNKWQLKYEGNLSLGNTQRGDGRRFCGRGLIQITGRINYAQFGADFFGDDTMFTDNPALVEQPYYAVLSAIWFWNKKGLNKLADTNNFEALTKRINPAKLGYKKRVAYWRQARQLLTTNSMLQ